MFALKGNFVSLVVAIVRPGRVNELRPLVAGVGLALEKRGRGIWLPAKLGDVTLEFYLMHGIFVELFGYNFLDITNSLVYIKNVPLFIAAVLACAVISTLLFRLLWKKVNALLTGGGKNQADKAEPGISGTEEAQQA